MEPDDRGGKTLTAKEYLRRYQDANREINALLKEIHNLRLLATSITQGLSPDRVQTTPANRTESIISKIVDMEKEVDTRVDLLHSIKNEVMQTINAVEEPICREVLIRRYICGDTWEKIAVDMNYTYQWVCVLHGRALELIRIDSN